MILLFNCGGPDGIPPRSDSEPGRYTQNVRSLTFDSRPSHPSISTKLIFYPKGLKIILADRTGFEPATSSVTGKRSNQLSYRSNIIFLYQGRDSNSRPQPYEGYALTD